MTWLGTSLGMNVLEEICHTPLVMTVYATQTKLVRVVLVVIINLRIAKELVLMD